MIASLGSGPLGSSPLGGEAIGVSEAISLIQGVPTNPFNSEKADWQLQYASLRVQAILEERKELRNMRIRWSNWILICIIAIVIFNFLVVSFVGFGIVTFPEENILPAFLAQSLINVIGLAIIIVKYLFSNWGELPKD